MPPSAPPPHAVVWHWRSDETGAEATTEARTWFAAREIASRLTGEEPGHLRLWGVTDGDVLTIRDDVPPVLDPRDVSRRRRLLSGEGG